MLLLLSFFSIYLPLKKKSLLMMIGHDFRKRFQHIESGDKIYVEELHRSSNPLIDIIAAVMTRHATHSNDIRAEVAYLFHRNFATITRDIT